MKDLFDSAGEDEDGVKRDHWGRYLLPRLSDGKEVGHTRATTFAKTIADTYLLNMWGRRMVLKGATLRPDLFALAGATPLEDKEKLNQIAESCAEAAGSKTAAGLGTAAHAFSVQSDEGKNPIVPGILKHTLTAYRMLVEQHKLVFTHSEQIVRVPAFTVAGTLDRIGYSLEEVLINGAHCLEAEEPAIIDLKTGGNDLKYAWGEIVVQLALYANADAVWDKDAEEYLPMPDVNKKIALVIHFPAGQAEATLYAVNIKAGWEAAEHCQWVREWRKRHDLFLPVDNGHVMVNSWEAQIKAASSREELQKIHSAAKEQGAWTPALLALGQARLSELGK